MKLMKKALALSLCLSLCFSVTGIAQDLPGPEENAVLVKDERNNAEYEATEGAEIMEISLEGDDISKPEISITPKEGTKQKTFANSHYCEAPTVTVFDDSGETISVTVNEKYSQEIENGNEVDLHGETGKIAIHAEDKSGNESNQTIYIDHYPGGRYEMVVEPTCTTGERKLMSWLCKYCGESYSPYDITKPETARKALGHEYDPTQSQTIEAPCGEEGPIEVSPCKRCGVMVKSDNTEYAAEADESHSWSEVKTVAPTCVKAGYQYKECQICKIKEKIEGSDTKPTSHRYGEWVNAEPLPACGKQGMRTRTCLNDGCTPETAGHSQTETYTKWHNYSSVRTVTKKATCDAPGQTGFKCSDCDSVFEPRETAALGHDYAADGDCTTPSKCTRCDAQLDGMEAHKLEWRHNSLGHWQVCTNEDCEYTTMKDNGGREYPHDNETNGDCLKGYQCQCGYNVAPKSAHKLGVWKSEGDFHWRECTNPGCNYQSTKETHNFKVSELGDCTKDRTCTVCKQLVKAKYDSHDWSESYTHTISHHYKACTHPGCTVKTGNEEHTYNTGSNDCTKGRYCTECGYVSISGNARHNYAGEPWKPDESDPSRHYRECINGNCEVREYASHTGGTATCTSKKQCTECHAVYGEKDMENHAGPFETNRNYKAPTLMEKGYSGDKYCEGCQTVVEKGHDLPALSEGHEHTYGDQQFNDVESWYECSICGYHDRVVPHRLGSFVYEDGTGHYKQCESCKYKATPVNHHASESKYDNDCTTEVTCDDCGYVMVEKTTGHQFAGAYGSDEDGHWQVCRNPDCGVASQKADHVENKDADCTTAVLCSVCGHTLLEAEPEHNWDTVWQSDETGHYHNCRNIDCKAQDKHPHHALEDDGICTTPTVCADCEYEMNPGKEEHAFGGDYLTNEKGHWRRCQNPNCTVEEGESAHTGKATCAEKATCTECGVSYGEKDPTNHTGQTEIRNHRNPTETEYGYTGDTYCLGCGQILKEGFPIDPVKPDHEHVWETKYTDTHHRKECTVCEAWSEEEEHTLTMDTDDGTHTEKCSECGYVKDPEPHIYGKWETNGEEHWKTCEVCGYKTEENAHTSTWVKDGNGHHRECLECSYAEGAKPHNFDSWDKTDAGHSRTCRECGYESGMKEHSLEWKTDDAAHWQECRECGYQTEKQGHVAGLWNHDTENHWKICEACQAVIGKEKHTFEGKWCSECGMLNSNFVEVTGTNQFVENKDSVDKTLKDAVQDLIEEGGKLGSSILEALEDGKDINVELSVEDHGVTDNVKHLDITIHVYADGNLLGDISELSEPIQFSVPVEGMKGRIFCVTREHDGKRTEIESRLEGKTIHFASDLFSDFYIEAINDISKADVSAIPDQEYTGREICPSVTVTVNREETLKEGKDYTISYKNNIEEGTATVIITGINDFEGSSKMVTFRIIRKENMASSDKADNGSPNAKDDKSDGENEEDEEDEDDTGSYSISDGSSRGNGSGSVQTGDNMLLFVELGCAFLMFTIAFLFFRKKRENS